MDKTSRILLGLALAFVTFLITAFVAAIVLVLIAPMQWHVESQVAVNWDQMPMELAGDERGVVGRVIQSAYSDPANVCSTFANKEEHQHLLGLNAVDLTKHV